MIRHPGRVVVVLALAVAGGAGLLALLAARASADYIVLENGRALQGTIEEEGPDTVRIRQPGGIVSVPRDRIRSIHRGDEPPPEAAGAGERIEDKGEGGPKAPAAFRYLDGANPVTGEVLVPVFTLLKPAGTLAHGSLVQLLEVKSLNGVRMARVKLGEAEGWLPEECLREAPAAPVMREAPR